MRLKKSGEIYLQKKKIQKENSSSSAGIALDLNSGCPIMEMIGNRRVTIEGSTGLLRYESENIKVNTAKIVLSFSGRNLTVSCISSTEVVIEGFITNIEFIT